MSRFLERVWDYSAIPNPRDPDPSPRPEILTRHKTPTPFRSSRHPPGGQLKESSNMHGDEMLESLREALRHSPENYPCGPIWRKPWLAWEGSRRPSRSFARHFPIARRHRHQIGTGGMLLPAGQDEPGDGDRRVPGRRPRHARPKPHVLYARLLLDEGDVAGAVAQYKLALEPDPDADDPELGQRLGILPEDEAGDVFEGRVRESWQSRGRSRFDTEVERPQISFRMSAGWKSVKEEIR